MLGYVGIGSNVGDREAHLRIALEEMARAGVVPLVTSAIWETEPIGGAGPAWFLNMVARVRMSEGPFATLERLQRIERRCGRVRTGRNAPRPLDLDLLMIDDFECSDPRLTVPHPRMWERRFVLAPLSEIDPTLRHPVTGERVDRALRRLEGGEVVWFGPPPAPFAELVTSGSRFL